MEHCDFASVAKIIHEGYQEEMFSGQTDIFVDLLSDCIFADENAELSYDNSQVNRWLNGLSRLSPIIIRYFADDRDGSAKNGLCRDLRDKIIPKLADPHMVFRYVYDLLTQDPSVSEQKKDELLASYTKDTADITVGITFLADVLIFGIVRPYQKHDVRKAEIAPAGNLSPVVRDYVFDEGVPKPCKHFCGRADELKILHGLLLSNSKVFLHGIPGIGKSEIAKAYAAEHKKEYTNILWLTYTGDLKRDITDMDFADDLPSDDETARFKKHNRFLRTLKEDTLFIIDNFDATEAQDGFLSVVLGYRCRVLFTTRSRISGRCCLEIEEIEDAETLFQLAAQFFSTARVCRSTVEAIIETVHYHTLAVELAARLLESGILSPQEVLDRLQQEKAAFSASDEISMLKDGKSSRATYYDHIRTLFALFKLSEEKQGIMRSLSLIPLTGIPARLFAQWMDLADLNEVGELEELGIIQTSPGNHLSLHPMMQEVAIADLKPSVTNCRTMLEHIHQDCITFGINLPYYKIMFQTIGNTIRYANKDDLLYYIRLLEDVFQYMEGYDYRLGMTEIVDELSDILQDKTIGTDADRAPLLDYRARLESDTKKRIRLIQEGLDLLPVVNPDNALLVSNLDSNLGQELAKMGDKPRAKAYLETALSITDRYHLFNHDTLVQCISLASVASDLGHVAEALSIMEMVERSFAEAGFDTADHAEILHRLGILYINVGDGSRAVAALKKSYTIFSAVYAEEPDLLRTKQDEINAALVRMGLPGLMPNRIKSNS